MLWVREYIEYECKVYEASEIKHTHENCTHLTLQRV